MPGSVRLLLALLVLASCSAPAPVPPAGSADLDARVRAARYQLAADPTDAVAHLRLARLEHEAGRPGAARIHFEQAQRGTKLPGDDRRLLARLYLDRAAQRLGLGDGGAWQDLDRARGLDRTLAIADELAAAALFKGALAALRHSDRTRRAEAIELLARARSHAPGDPRLAALDSAGAPLEDLAHAAAWVWDGGARRAGLELLETYYERGGRDPAVVQRFLEARWWWGGARMLPGLLALDRLWATGINPCRFAMAASDHGCARTLEAVAADPDLAAAVWERAASHGWRSARPADAGAWVILALRAWLAGAAPSPGGAIGARLDVAALARDPEGLPLYAAPTILRLAGRTKAASAALERALEAAAQQPAWARAALVLEAALAGDDAGGAIDRILAAGAPDPLALTVAALAARAAGSAEREARLLSSTPEEWSHRYLLQIHALGPLATRTGDAAARHRLARWRHALAGAALAPGRELITEHWRALGYQPDSAAEPDGVVPLGHPAPLEVAARVDRVEHAAPAAIAAIARAFAREPAVADRLAREYAGGTVAAGARSPLLAALFAGLGDPVRALRWAEVALEESPAHPPYLFAVAAYAASSGDLARAEVHFTSAAAADGDPGASALAAARLFLALARPLEAVQMGRRALDLTAPGADIPVLEVLRAAATELGRAGDAAAITERLAARTRALPAEVPALAGAATDRDWAIEQAAAAEPAAALALLREAAAWNPGDVAVRAALLDRLDPGDPEAAAVAAQLLAIALSSGRATAIAAYRVLEEAFERLGANDAAAAARAETRQAAPLTMARPGRPGR